MFAPRSILRCLRPALVAEWTLDTAAAMIDCPPGLWKMSKADRAFAVLTITKNLRGTIGVLKIRRGLTVFRGSVISWADSR